MFALPRGVSAKQLSPPVRALSVPRDAEAMATTLQAAARAAAGAGALAAEEADALALALEALAAERAEGFRDASRALSSRALRDALRALRAATSTPVARKVARAPAREGAERLLTDSAEALFSHEAWCVFRERMQCTFRIFVHVPALMHAPLHAPARRALGELAPPAHENSNSNNSNTPGAATAEDAGGAPWERVLCVERGRCAVLHDLRKSIREARYRMELFAPLYDAAPSSFQQQLSALVALQGALGTMHDVQVCLAAQPRLARCAALAGALAAAHEDAWAAFRRGRGELLAPAGRSVFARALRDAPPRLDADSS